MEAPLVVEALGNCPVCPPLSPALCVSWVTLPSRSSSRWICRSWSWETTLSGTLNVTRNVASSLDQESRFPLAVLEYVAGWTLFTARCYASAVLAMGLCPSVCLSVCACHKPVFY